MIPKKSVLNWLDQQVKNAKDQVEFLQSKSAPPPELNKQRERHALLSTILTVIQDAPDWADKTPRITSEQEVRLDRAAEKEKAKAVHEAPKASSGA